MIVIFGKYRCLVLMEFDKSLVFEGYRKDDLYMVDFSISCMSSSKSFRVLALASEARAC